MSLRERLDVFTNVMFWAFVVFRVGEVALYRTYPEVTPAHYSLIVAVGAASLVLLVATRLVLARAQLSENALRRLDLALMVSSTSVFGATAVLAYNRPETAYTCLIYACLVVFVRSIIVPSSGPRTAVIATISFVPIVAAAAFLAVTTKQDVPGPAFFAGAAMYSATAIAIAIAGSRIIYGLRKRAASELELGQYRLERKLGGEVYLARHALLRRPTAVKLLPAQADRELVARWERAVREMSHLVHHNTAAVFDYGHSLGGTRYFAMEYLEGLDLVALGTVPAARAAHILVQVCRALHEAHGRGFTHGNLEATNIFIVEDDIAKVTDYGFAGEASEADDLRAVGVLARRLADLELPAAPTAKELATALAPLAAGWTPAHAREWWTQLRRQSSPSLPVPETIAIDLARRAG